MSALEQWFEHNFGINHKPSDTELQTSCPKCGYSNFYFSISKRVGICHRASCNFRPNLHALEQLVNSKYIKTDSNFDDVFKPPPPIELPLNHPVIHDKIGDKFYTYYMEDVKYLQKRGLTSEDIMRFDIRSVIDGILVPVYEEGKLVNYVLRSLKTGDYRYRYAKGSNKSWYLFGWDEAKLWNRLTLVENTFVSIWLRDELQCTTTFGSTLSEVQLDKIQRSNVKQVAILWDEGAEERAEKAVKELHKRSIPAAFARLKGQPDDYTKEEIIKIGESIHGSLS